LLPGVAGGIALANVSAWNVMKGITIEAAYLYVLNGLRMPDRGNAQQSHNNADGCR
jgi:hypothetical protein